MSEKKMVSRNVAILLGIICVFLIAFIAYFTVTGISAQNSYNNLQNQNKQLQTWLNGNETLLNQTQATLDLGKSTVLYNGTVTIVPSLEMTNLEENTPYAGYVSVQVSSPQKNETVAITVVWDYYPILRYQNDFSLGSSGTAVFPVLPPGMVVYFFDPNLVGTGSSETTNVTITYHY